MIPLRVIYPSGPGRIVLRTDADWNADIAPTHCDPASGVLEFQVTAFQDREPRPYLYYKPVLIEPSGRALWAKGENHLAITTSHAWEARSGRPLERESSSKPHDCHPYFYEEPSCSVCDLLEASGLDGSLGHRFRVFVPPGYHENTLRRYPVLYMHDGQNLFLEEEAFLGNTWKADEVLGVLTAMTAVEPVIVVGVFPNEREREYTKPGYDAYARFLVEKLKPLIDRTYRTKPGPATTAAMGSSLGGVASLYLGWQHPDVFGQVACLSSTFGWRDDLMQRIAREPRRPIRIYLDSGWPGDNYEVTLAMRDRLLESGYGPGDDLLSMSFPNAAHNESAWSARSHVPYQFLFGRHASAPGADLGGVVRAAATALAGNSPSRPGFAV